MHRALSVVLAAAVGSTLVVTPGRPPQHYSYVGKRCATMPGGIAVVIGGATVATISDPDDFSPGSSCTVIPPASVPSSIGLRCDVDSGGTATIRANTAVALGATAPAGEWCVEVRTVAPAFVE